MAERKTHADKFDATKKEGYLDALRQGARRGAAAEAVGVTRQTVHNHLKAHPEFAEEVSRAEMEANDLVVDALFQAAISGNVVAIQVWLYNRVPEEWADKRNLRLNAELVGKDGGPIVIERRPGDTEPPRRPNT